LTINQLIKLKKIDQTSTMTERQRLCPVSDGTHTANLALFGQYAAAEFATGAAAGSGMAVTYEPAPPGSGSIAQALPAKPHH
jgi:hypothetical protein